MKKLPYLTATSGMYINFFILGMVNIIFASNMNSLIDQLGTTATGISFLLSGFGIGKLATYALTGYLSDKFGRKPLVAVSSILMMLFLVGFTMTSNYQIAFALAIVMGIGNSAMDSGTYPALTESYPESAGTANVLAKLFNTIGAILLPVFITFFANNNMSYKFSFYLPAVFTGVALILVLFAKFPSQGQVETTNEEANEGAIEAKNPFNGKPKLWVEGLALIIIGFTSLALLMIAPLWLPTIAQEVLMISEAQSVTVLSYYSIGSFVSVLLLAVALKKVSPITIMVVYPIITILSYLVLLTTNSAIVGIVGAFFLGLSISGILQLAITVITQLFWQNKGTMTGVISTSGSLAVTIMPALTGMMINRIGIVPIIWLEILIAAIGLVAALVVMYRYKQLTKPTETATHYEYKQTEIAS